MQVDAPSRLCIVHSPVISYVCLISPQFAQELLSTFNLSLGEVALQPSTGGVFIVKMYHGEVQTEGKVLWDRKTDGGFPETKELKRRVRDVIEPGRDLGHVDKDYKREETKEKSAEGGAEEKQTKKCEDCN